MDIELSALIAPFGFFVVAGLVFAPLESLFEHESRPKSATRTNVLFALVSATLVRLVMITFVGVGLTWLYRASASYRAELPWHRTEGWASALTVMVGIVVFELASYGYHRAAHRYDVLFRLHAVHHSSEQLGWLASFRQHPLEILLMTIAQNVPLILLGLPLGAHALVVVLIKLNTVFVHSDIELPRGAWERVFAGPRFHHRHHDVAGNATNYSSLLPFIDTLFGTYSGKEAKALGLSVEAPSGFVALMLWPFRSRT